MNNILSFCEYNGQELERVVYDNELNEKKMLRGFFNKRAANKVKEELAEEIEMSKAIMEGIKQGLESLDENFNAIKKDLDDNSDDTKGEKQKSLDEIMKIIETSRKNTWDLNELIDEGEVDYAGFTANIGIASVAYFGILLTPFRAAVMMHKGYNYFFGIIKNTVRKALVMLQLNFDQFENLIIKKGFQSADYLQDQDTSVKISEFYGKLYSKLFDDKTGSMTGKKGSSYAKEQMQLARNQIDAMMKADKARKLSDNAYNCLDEYNNTYTRSLETLRNYSQEDVQKYLDAIKTSMSKLAGQEADLQTYSELIIAAAEEHAYKISTSIYNKFGKMTEVFSLPNQKKLIDLIQAATKEQMDNAAKEKEKHDNEVDKEKAEERMTKLNNEGSEIFKSKGGKLGDLDADTNKYSDVEGNGWDYSKYDELNDDDKITLERWLGNHPEVLEKCEDSLKIVVNVPENDMFQAYVDSLIDYVNPCVYDKVFKGMSESAIMNFDQYLLEESSKKDKEEWKQKLEDAIKEKDRNLLWDSLTLKKDKNGKESRRVSREALKYVIDELERLEASAQKDDDKEEQERYSNWINFLKGKLADHEGKKKSGSGEGSSKKSGEGKEEGSESGDEKKEEEKKEEEKKEEEPKEEESKKDDEEKSKDDSKEPEEEKKSEKDDEPTRRMDGDLIYYLDFNKLKNEKQLGYLRKLYDKHRELAKIALKLIGERILEDNTFSNNAESVIDCIVNCLNKKSKKVEIKSVLTYNILTKSVKELDDSRSNDYLNSVNKAREKEEEEKSEA